MLIILVIPTQVLANNNSIKTQTIEQEDVDRHRVLILFDSSNRIIDASSRRLAFLLRSVYPYADYIGVNNYRDLIRHVAEDYEVVVLYFNCSSKSIIIGEDQVDWSELVDILRGIKGKEFVLLMGNTYTLDSLNAENMHYPGSELSVPLSLEVFALWEIASILERRGVENDTVERIKLIAAKHYVDNLDYLFESRIKPTVVIGSKDEEYRQRRLKAFLERNPEALRVNTVKRSSEDTPVIAIRSMYENPDELLDLMDFPSLSGLSGNVGDFIDKILEFLSSGGVETLGIPINVVNDALAIFRKIYDFIGDPSKLGSGSDLLEFLQEIGKDFPYISNYSSYFDMFIYGFYALKGNASAIQNFIDSAVDLLLPDNSSIASTLDSLKTIIDDILSIKDDVLSLYEKITKNKINVFLNYIIQYISNFTLDELLESVETQYNETIRRAIKFLSSIIIDQFTIPNTTYIINKLLEIPEIIDIFDSTPDVSDTIRKIAKLAQVVMCFANKEDVSIEGKIKEAILEFIPQDAISDVESMLNDIMDLMDTAIKEAETDAEKLKGDLMNILDTYITSTDPEIVDAKNIIRDALILLPASIIPEFDLSNIESFASILRSVLAEYLDSASDDFRRTYQLLNATILPLALMNAPSLIQKLFFGQVNPLLNKKGLALKFLYEAIRMIIEEVDPTINIDMYLQAIKNATSIVMGLSDLISQIKDRPLDGITTAFMMISGISQFSLFEELNITQLFTFMGALLPDLMGMNKSFSLSEAKSMILNALGELASNSTIKDTMIAIMDFLFEIREVMRNGIKWLTTKIIDWATNYAVDFLEDLLGDLEQTLKQFSLLNISGSMNFGIGGIDQLAFEYEILVDAGVQIETKKILNTIKDVLLKGEELEFDDIEGGFKQLLEFINIVPTLQAKMKLKAMFREESDILSFIMENLGVDVSIEGEARFKLKLFAFKEGSFDTNELMDLEEWYLSFSLEISRTFTIFDLLGMPEVSSVAKYLGLDAITITLSLGLKIEINLGSESSGGVENSILMVELTIAGTLHIGVDIEIAEVSLDASLSVTFTFKATPAQESNPLTFGIRAEYSLKIHAEFLFVGKTWKWSGTLLEYTFPEGNEKPTDYMGGFDADNDGLPDTYETATFGYAPNRSDTDGDGITDADEINVYRTDPLDSDTDGDGLSDGDEVFTYHTNPLSWDTDGDRLKDYVEAMIYGTNPREVDTDGDGLDDYFEVNHIWDIESVTISITGVRIGNTTYYDRTDPLNPDTDGDGLLDGQEGPLGGYYADAAYSFDPDPTTDPNPIIFNYGYTHPLDNDTDDDSYKQLPNGKILEPREFLRSMTDKEEIEGITVVFIDPEEGPVQRTFRTNPICPDTDMDTGSSAVLLSDGYELALNPPSDPLDGDSDDDGLIDGDEGTTSPISNKTDRLDPDTDDDGLGDLQEIVLGLDPTRPDTDGDLVSDGDEFLVFGTDPTSRDSDNDLLSDGEELYYWHSNPMMKDSDADGINDGFEVLWYFTNPMDEDTDNDNLTDLEEIFIYGTIPQDADSDGDNIVDGEEIFIYKTNPLAWDSDNDSITYPNEYGEYTWPMSDYDEIFIYGTDPLSSDTDKDGISDSFEAYIAQGNIPNFTNIPIDPTENDTDGDGLLDGFELSLVNVSSIIYPYVAYYIVYPMNSSPVLVDTDNDNLSDYDEVMIYSSNANLTDSDRDNLTDYSEVAEYGTNPAFWDTDHDGLSDYYEIMQANNTTKAISLSATDPDVDDDLLPDGYEIEFLGTDPLNPDENNNGIIDGLEFDSDLDMLADGLEFYVYNTSMIGGGPLDPDSDNDGLSDGAEVYYYHTNVTNPDTDGDGIPDGAEVAVGTDPLTYTSWEEYQAAVNQLLGNRLIKILTPRGSIIDRYVNVRVLNGTTFTSMWFMYIKDGEASDNYTLTYDPETLQWVYSKTNWTEGNYTIVVYGLEPNGRILSTSDTFQYTTIETPPTEEPPKPNILLWILIGIVIGICAEAAAIFLIRRYGGLISKKFSSTTQRMEEEAAMEETSASGGDEK